MESTGRERQDAALQPPVIQRQSTRDFFDSSLEWRRVFAETWGTFLLVLVAAGGGVVAAMSGGGVTLGMMVVAPGLMVMAIIYFMGAVSGAHLNPAVTLAFAVRRNFPWKRVPGYIVGQVIGGIGAAVFLRAMFGTVGALGATLPGRGVTNGKALAMEVVLTTGLVNTILSTASGARNIGTNGALAIGGYIALAGLWAAPVLPGSVFFSILARLEDAFMARQLTETSVATHVHTIAAAAKAAVSLRRRKLPENGLDQEFVALNCCRSRMTRKGRKTAEINPK